MIKIFKNTIFISLITLFSSSCVYYNTFYNAETSFDKANELIEESAQLDSGEIPSQAGNLLEKSIENSFLVIEKYPESKYVDDAIYLIGRSTLLLNDVAMAERYLSKLIENYPHSEFTFEAKIWLSYTHFKMGELSKAESELNEILVLKPKRKKDKYIIHTILAEIALEKRDKPSAYMEYETSIKYASYDSKKYKVYSILADLAEKDKNYKKLVGYLENIDRYAAKSEIRRDAKMLWLEINRKLENYDLIIEEIDKLLGLSEYSSIKIKLELERAKVYMDMGDFQTAQGYLETLVEEYTKKNETAEAYYHLGAIQLLQNFNLSLALELFEKSKEEKARSEYGKESNKAKELIEDYTILVEDYKYLTEEQPAIEDSVFFLEEFPDTIQLDNEMIMPSPETQTTSTESNPDSLLFRMGQILYFDFFRKDSAMGKYIHLVNEYPNSKFAPQSLYILDQFFPDQDWHTKLVNEYPQSEYLQNANLDSTVADTNKVDLLITMRDSAWDLQIESYNQVKNRFLQIAEEYDDAISLYSAGLVADVYLNNLSEAIEIYKKLTKMYPEHEQSIVAHDRMNEITSTIESELHKIEQEKLFYNALSLIQKEYLLDSAKVVLNQVKSGENTPIKSSASKLIQKIDILSQIESKIQTIISDTTEIEIDSSENKQIQYHDLDSLYFMKANIFKINFVLNDSAISLYNYIVQDFIASPFRPYSILHLGELDTVFNWNDFIFSEYPDSTYHLDSTIVTSPFIATTINEEYYSILDGKYENMQSFLSVFDTIQVDSSFQNKIVIDTLVIDSTIFYFKDTEFPWEAVYNWNINTKLDSAKQSVFEVMNVLQNNVALSNSTTYSEYVVVNGDDLGKIAEKIYNSQDAWTILILDNEELLLNSDGKVTTGMKLQIRYEFKENR